MTADTAILPDWSAKTASSLSSFRPRARRAAASGVSLHVDSLRNRAEG